MIRFARPASYAPWFSCLVLAVSAGCGSGGLRAAFEDDEQPTEPADNDQTSNGASSGSFGGQAAGDVQLDPLNTTIIIDTATKPVTPGTITYKVKSKGQDATASATLAIDDAALGKFNGATFTSTDNLPNGALGVSTTVQATTKDGVGL